jgi:hypothetical protein
VGVGNHRASGKHWWSVGVQAGMESGAEQDYRSSASSRSSVWVNNFLGAGKEFRVVTNLSQLKSFTKILVGILVTFAGLMQVQEVRDFILPLVTAHPRIASIVSALIGMAALVHNPKVQHLLGLDEEIPPVKEVEPNEKPKE